MALLLVAEDFCERPKGFSYLAQKGFPKFTRYMKVTGIFLREECCSNTRTDFPSLAGHMERPHSEAREPVSREGNVAAAPAELPKCPYCVTEAMPGLH